MLTSPFVKLSKSNEKKATTILFFLLLALIILMRYFDAPLKNEISQKGIISFELAKDLAITKNIIHSWNTQAKQSAYLSIEFDFLFLVIYSTFISLLIHKLVNQFNLNSFFLNLGKLLIWISFLAASFDILENIALLQSLSGNLHQIWSSSAYYFALSKFLLILVCIAYILIGWLLVLAHKFRPEALK